MNFIENFAKHCENASDFIAVVDNEGKRKTTYGELFVISKKIANKLIKMGIKKYDNVIIALPRCMEYMASIYGIIFASACYVPLSDNYPEERKKQIINEVEATVIIDDDFIKDIDSFEMIDNILTSADQNINIIYTSGSTGDSKGVLSDFERMDLYIERIKAVSKMVDVNIELFMYPFNFVAHMCAVFQLSDDKPGTLHLITDEKAKDLGYIANYIDK